MLIRAKIHEELGLRSNYHLKLKKQFVRRELIGLYSHLNCHINIGCKTVISIRNY